MLSARRGPICAEANPCFRPTPGSWGRNDPSDVNNPLAIAYGPVCGLGAFPAVAASPGSVISDVFHHLGAWILIDEVKRDLREVGLGRALGGVALLDMRKHAQKDKLKMFAAWTNSETTIYVNADALPQVVDMLRRDIPSVTNPERMAQLVFGAVLVRHELIHVKQFAAAKRPQTYADMCKCEVAAYRDTAKWMRAARTDLRDLGLTDAVIDYFQRLQLDIQTHAEATLKEITQLDTEEQRKEVMVREEFLPEHGTIDELYKA